MQATLVTTKETSTGRDKISQVLQDLETHVGQNHGQVHIGHSITNPSEPYSDSAGQAWPASNGRVSAFLVSGTTYYVPSQAI